ncbi:MAG: DUF3991 and TOPRIM domain-containing protein [Planctomycetota bacterium]
MSRGVGDREEELERFKTELDLAAVAGSLGFELDRRASSRNCPVLRHTDGTKIVVGRNPANGHWVYFNVHDDRDRGSVIDLLGRRRGLNLGQVRQELRRMTGSPPPRLYDHVVKPVAKDRMAVLAAWEAAEVPVGDCRYLTTTRGIPATVWASERFHDRIRIDRYGNVLFPHFGLDEGKGLSVCGFEIKQDNITRFSTGGTRGLWASQAKADDCRLALTESAIDAISHCACRPDTRTRYVSTGGEIGKAQRELLVRAMAKMPERSLILLAFDHDAGGDKLIGVVEDLFEQVGRPDLELVEERPLALGRDWNAELRAMGKENQVPPEPS